MKWLDKLRTMLEVVKVLPSILQTVEAAIPGQGQGELKLELVRQMLEAAIAAAGIAVDVFKEVWPKIKELIDAIVALFNEVGVFHKS
jgi:hypothetical protein